MPISALAKDPTTIVYETISRQNPVFFVIADGSLTEKKAIEDRIQTRLPNLRIVKSHLILPPEHGNMSQDEIQELSTKLNAEDVTALLFVNTIPLQGKTECWSTAQNKIYGMPEFGVQSNTVCDHVDNWIYRISILNLATKKISAVSELSASDHTGIFQEFTATFGSKISNQMLDRMIKSLQKNKAF